MARRGSPSMPERPGGVVVGDDQEQIGAIRQGRVLPGGKDRRRGEPENDRTTAMIESISASEHCEVKRLRESFGETTV